MPRALPDIARRTVTLETARRSIDIPVDGNNRWRRALPANLQLTRLRRDGDGEGETAPVTSVDDTVNGARFTGTAIVYNSPTWIGSKRWGFWEVMEAGCATKTIREKRGENNDITFNRDHDNRLLFARTSNGTLRFADSDTGLAVDADMGPYSYTVDTIAAIIRRDLTGMSFAFDAITYEWSIAPDGSDLLTHREIELFDTAVVGMPAYADTDCEMRLDILATARAAGIDGLSYDTLARRLANPDPELVEGLRALAGSTPPPAPAARRAPSAAQRAMYDAMLRERPTNEQLLAS